MIHRIGLAAAACLLPTSASAQTMNAEEFYQRATKIQKRGTLAVFSMGEAKSLMKEGQAAAERARQQRLAALSAGQKPRYCPPAVRNAMSPDEFLQRLGAIPPTQLSTIDITEATTRVLAAKHPCPK